MIQKLECEICNKEYEKAIIYSYELHKIACIPCIRKHSQPERLNPENARNSVYDSLTSMET